MNLIDKIIRGDEIRPSRLHTEAGDLCAADAVLDFPLALWTWARHKFDGYYDLKPWWVYRAVSEVEKVLLPTDKVLELGSGYSSLWLAQRCKSVYSIEETGYWSQRVSSQAYTLGLRNLKIATGRTKQLFENALQTDPDWTVVVIDSPRDRLQCFKELLRLERKPRLIIYDDTDKQENREALDSVQNYNIYSFRGFKPQTLHVCETSLFKLKNPNVAMCEGT